MGFIKATPWSMISFDLMGLLFVALSLAPIPCSYADTKKGMCWYVLEVKTSGLPHVKAGTDNPVRLRLMDKQGSNVTIHPLKDPIDGDKSEPFKRGNTATFNISGPCLQGEMCSLQFQVQGEGHWRVDYAKVHGENGPLFECSYHKTLPSNAWSGYDLCHSNPQSASSPQEFIACNKNDESETEKKKVYRKKKFQKKSKFLV